MELAKAVLFRVTVMFVVLIVGAICYKAKLIGQSGKKQLSNILLYVIMPSVIFNSFIREREEALMSGFFCSIITAVVVHIVSIAIAYLIYHKKDDRSAAVSRFGVVYSNCGYIGIPIISSMLGDVGVFYLAAHLAITNIFGWTHGYVMMSGKKEPKEMLRCLLSPAIIAAVGGFAVFLLGIPVPSVISAPIKSLADCNTALAMFVVGISVAQTNVFKSFTDLKVLKMIAVRNLLLPAVTLILCLLLPFERNVLICGLVYAACPCAANTAILAAKFGHDDAYGAKCVTLTTLMTVVSIPLSVLVFDLLVK